MTDIDTAARYAVEGRRSFPPRPLSPAQQAAALAYRGSNTRGMEDRRRLRINDGISIQRAGGQISVVFSNDGMIHSAATLTNEQARRAAEALSFYAATADAVDVEDDEMGRAA